MRRLFTIIAAVLLTATIWAQSPQKMSYQAVIRNSSDQLITSHAVGMRVSILKGTNPVYVETHATSTNSNGLVTIEIGGGTFVSGIAFSAIDWSAGEYSIKTETDPTGGTNYTAIVGTSQLLSVPYALYAKTVASYTETDPIFVAWNKSTGINITASQVTDFQSSVTNNAAVLLNTAKETNTTHTGDATGSGALTLATVNSNVGTFNNITINAKGLATAGSNVSYLTSETDPIVKAITGIVKSNGTTISAATAGTDYLTPTGSAASLTGFPTLNQNTTGSAATFTGSLVGDVTGTQGATVVGNSAVIGKVLTGYASGVGTVAATDNILQAIQKLNGNDATNANLTGMVTSIGNETTVITNANLTGEITSSGNATTITNNAVTNAKLATMATATLKGRVTAGTGNVEDLTATQVRTLLNVADGATNYTHPTGDGNLHVPATGTTNNSKVLTAGETDGALSWETPTTGGSIHYIGESYGGSIVFYVYDNGQHGLIVTTGNLVENIRWDAGTYTNTMAQADGVGAGKANTTIIIANQGYGDGATYASRICNEYSVTLGGVTYGDWYLPSKF